MINVFTTVRGWSLIVTGTLVGGLFAAFAFAISVFSVPMLVSSRRDALTAMGTSFAMTVQNLVPMLAWGAIVTAGLAISALTGLLALIVIFPVLGHGTWHAWRAIAQGRGMEHLLSHTAVHRLGLVGLASFVWALPERTVQRPGATPDASCHQPQTKERPRR